MLCFDDEIIKYGQVLFLMVPESLTHSTSAQRVRWFRKGYETGDVSQDDTFNATQL
ncbi:neutral zinc metallopeptidase [Pontibacter sp. HJ8]